MPCGDCFRFNSLRMPQSPNHCDAQRVKDQFSSLVYRPVVTLKKKKKEEEEIDDINLGDILFNSVYSKYYHSTCNSYETYLLFLLYFTLFLY